MNRLLSGILVILLLSSNDKSRSSLFVQGFGSPSYNIALGQSITFKNIVVHDNHSLHIKQRQRPLQLIQRGIITTKSKSEQTIISSLILTSLHASGPNDGGGTSVDITTPTPDEAADMGIRDWPQKAIRNSFVEQIKNGSVRYVLDGTGSLTATDPQTGSVVLPPTKIGPGSKIDVASEGTDCELSWTVNGDDEMILLTPGFEDGAAFLGVAVVLVAVCGALVAGVGS